MKFITTVITFILSLAFLLSVTGFFYSLQALQKNKIFDSQVQALSQENQKLHRELEVFMIITEQIEYDKANTW